MSCKGMNQIQQERSLIHNLNKLAHGVQVFTGAGEIDPFCKAIALGAFSHSSQRQPAKCESNLIG